MPSEIWPIEVAVAAAAYNLCQLPAGFYDLTEAERISVATALLPKIKASTGPTAEQFFRSHSSLLSRSEAGRRPNLRQAARSEFLAAFWRGRVDAAKLLPADFTYNNSVIRFHNRLFMAYRLHWVDSRIGLAELDERFTPINNWRLPLTMGVAQEDPRLWIHRGELHVSYSALQRRNGVASTDVCYARLKESPAGWQVDREYAPAYAARDHWEKNWGFFEHAGDLYAVYWISPRHQVLRIDGDHAELVADVPCDLRKHGFIGGGAAPVLHGSEYYSFYHRRVGQRPDVHYTLDLYTFEARTPFRPLRHIPVPLLRPGMDDRPRPDVPLAVFPCGAFVDRGRWLVSFGYYDHWCELAAWPVDHIEASLEALSLDS